MILKKSYFGWGASALGLTLFLYLLTTAGLKHYLVAQLTSDCSSCRLTIENLSLTGVHSIRLREILFNLPISEHARIRGRVANLTLNLQLSSITESIITLQQVKVLGTDFEVLEGPSVAGASPSGPKNEKVNFLLKQVKVHQGTFRYINLNQYGKAVLTLSHIESNIDNWLISKEGVSKKEVTFDIKGKLQKSGKFEIHCRFPQGNKNETSHIAIDVTELPLSETNVFFQPQIGVRIEGQVDRLSSRMTIQSKQLKGHLDSQYQGLSVHFINDERRSEVSTLVQNVISSLSINTERPSKEISRPVQLPSVTWKENQSIFEFLLSGLKPAALELIRN